MARKITVPTETITIEFEDPQTGRPVGRPFPWTDFVKGLCSDQRFIEGCADVFAAIDLRKKLLDAKDVCTLDDAEWDVLVSIAKKAPFVPMVVYQIESYLRAITDAPCG